jgi:hypothetical protein
MRRSFVALIGVALLALSYGYGRADDRSADGQSGAITPLQVAEQYTSLYKKGQFHDAICTYWDFKTLLGIIFRDELKTYHPEEIDTMASLLGRTIEQILANPKLMPELKKARFDQFEQKQLSETLFAVRFLATFSNGKSVPNTLIFQHQANDVWRIVNAGTNNQALMSAQLHEQYLQTKMSPMEYMRGLASLAGVQK